jgi:quercetin dioxygenase-like cupin family protein
MTHDTDLPQVLGNTQDLVSGTPEGQDVGAVWKLTSSTRQLDSNVVRIQPDGQIHPHTGPDQDVLLHVLAGSGRITFEDGEADLVVGSLAWLPRRSQRSILAGPEGLSYLSVHTRRPGLSIGSPPPPSS